MKKVLLTVLILAASAVVMLLAGCSGGDSQTVAVVGDKKISVKEFEEWASGALPAFPTAEAELDKRRDILDSMIITELLIQAAYEKHIDQSEEVARVVLANRPRFLLDALYTKEIVDKVNVTDAEVKQFYDRLADKFRAIQVLVADPDTAQMLFERIKGGADIEQVAYDYSIDPSAKRNRGDIGYFVWGAMVDEFQNAVIQMQVGEISPPIKSQYGYHIIKLIDRTPNESRGSYDDMKESIRNQITARKRYKLTDEYFKMIKEKYPITVDPSPCQYVLAKREQLYPPQLLERMPRSDFDVEQLDRNERELVLATWTGGQMTIGEYLTQIQNIPVQYRPDLDDYDSLKTIVFELKKQDILTYEAILEGLDSNPEFQRKLNRFRDLAMAELMKNDSIPMPPLPTEAEARAYYEAHPEEFSNPAKVHVYEIMVSDELQAQKLSRDIKSLDDFKKKAKELTERPGKRSVEGDLGFIERDVFPELFDRAWKTPVGGVTDPIFANGHYSVLYVVDRSPAELKDFLGQKRTIIQKLSSQKANDTFAKWVEERKANTHIEIFDDVLKSTVDMSKYDANETSNTGTAG